MLTTLSEIRLAKAPTGIQGLDEITEGGLPKGRPTLVCGSAGCGKTLLSMEFLTRGALFYDEPGVFVAFEESTYELIQNVASIGFNLPQLIADKKIALDHIHIDRNDLEATGDYDLEGLFLRLGYAIDSIGAKRVAIDTLEVLFSSLSDQAILRSELRRLFRWLKDKGVTAIITAERGDGALTRHGLEEYVSDCVIVLDHRTQNQLSTRRLRVVKYRGSGHGTNEYPFLISDTGLSVMPITSLALTHGASTERVSTGIPRLDTMLGGGGIYRGSSVLISGTAGSGKSSMAAHMTRAACERGERCLYFAFEESPEQIQRNARSIGIDLAPYLASGLLQFHATRPTFHGLEMHLATMHKLIEDTKPALIIVDPVTNLTTAGTDTEVNAVLMRLIDFLKSKQITGVFMSLTNTGDATEQTDVGISSLMDTWLLLRFIESSGERNRGIYVLKSRGTAHSNQIREFTISPSGVELLDVYVGPAGLLTGAARKVQEAQEKAEALTRKQEIDRQKRQRDRRRAAVEAQIAALRADLEDDEAETQRLLDQTEMQDARLQMDREEMARARHADPGTNGHAYAERLSPAPIEAKRGLDDQS
jgi:circadian clock protein KaiC